MTGTFTKIFSSFKEGLEEMVELSAQIRITTAPILVRCIANGYENLEAKVIRELKAKDTVDSDVCCLCYREPYIPSCSNKTTMRWVLNNAWIENDATRYGIAYRAANRFAFGWKKGIGGYYTFFITHPKRMMLGEKSTLRDTLIAAGWNERGKQIHEVLIHSYECPSCGGQHSSYLVISRDYRYRNYVDYPKIIRGSGFGAPYVEIAAHSCEATSRIEPLQVVGRKAVSIEEAREYAKSHEVDLPHGFFDPVIENAVAGFFAKKLDWVEESTLNTGA